MSYRIIQHRDYITNTGVERAYILDELTGKVVAEVTALEGCRPLVELANRVVADAVVVGERPAFAEDDWSKFDADRFSQAQLDVEARVKEEGSLEKATARYLYEAMRSAQSSAPQYSPLMMEIEEVLRRNGFSP